MKSLLTASRYLMLVPIIGCLLLTAGLVLIGIIRPLFELMQTVQARQLTASSSKDITLAVIETIDIFLVATVAYVTAIGLYNIFISSDEVQLPSRMPIRTLTDLKKKIFGMLVLALSVAFMGKAFANSEQLIYDGIATGIIILTLGLFLRLTDAESNPDD